MPNSRPCYFETVFQWLDLDLSKELAFYGDDFSDCICFARRFCEAEVCMAASLCTSLGDTFCIFRLGSNSDQNSGIILLLLTLMQCFYIGKEISLEYHHELEGRWCQLLGLKWSTKCVFFAVSRLVVVNLNYRMHRRSVLGSLVLKHFEREIGLLALKFTICLAQST